MTVSRPGCQIHIWGERPDIYYCQRAAGLLMWGALSDERTGLLFTTAAGIRRYSHSRVPVLRDSDERLHQLGGPGSLIYEYITKQHGGPLISP
jgi:hypothetical protein